MDIHMPNMNGYESSTEILKACSKKMCAPPYIVALTAHVDEEVKKRCKDIGIKEVILKPIKMEELTRILKKVDLA